MEWSFQWCPMTMATRIHPYSRSRFWCSGALWKQWKETKKENRKEWLRGKRRLRGEGPEKYASRIAEACVHSDTGGLAQGYQKGWETGMMLLLFPHCVECFSKSFDSDKDKRSPKLDFYSVCLLLSPLDPQVALVSNTGACIRLFFSEWWPIPGVSILNTESS